MNNLGELMSLATSDLDSSETAAQVARRYQRRRRRGAVVSAVAACCVAAAGVVAVSASGVLDTARGVNEVVPAAPTASSQDSATPRPTASKAVVAASLSGVAVTWLPVGMTWTHETTVGTSKHNGQPVTSTSFVRVGAGSGYPEMSLSIQRNYTADLDSLSKEPAQSFEWVTIRGQRALMQDIEPMRQSLTWVDVKSKTTVSLEVIWVTTKKTMTGGLNEGGLTDTDLVRTVQGLVIGP